ncbi:MAG: hypothetical protein CPDRYMAC_5877 [uncultured Paraburkholderia sp.]|nr:MAG: hypothetical protein CPDRYDRY_5836 [uncultured Paraburkholderia sp.]CAH2942786.1 MAG: hypothetical protein CPDRYMAC_5877 [uncultured Paraburkholderia sp.]
MVREKERVIILAVLVLRSQYVELLELDDRFVISLRQDVNAKGLEGSGRQHPVNNRAKGEFATIVISVGTADAVIPVGVKQFRLGRDFRKFACHDAIFDQFGKEPKVKNVAQQAAQWRRGGFS